MSAKPVQRNETFGVLGCESVGKMMSILEVLYLDTPFTATMGLEK
jgi:hypothetical protein